jgi:hypothetical protein
MIPAQNERLEFLGGPGPAPTILVPNIWRTVKSMPCGPSRTAEQGRGPSKGPAAAGLAPEMGGPAGGMVTMRGLTARSWLGVERRRAAAAKRTAGIC